jgi:16S rRNA (cytosine967-C5)-methyltransferase
MAGLQIRLLEAVSRVVRPGGCVVYSTCSISSAESGAVVRRFLAEAAGDGFQVEPIGEIVPPEWAMFLDGEGCFQSWPTTGGPDGHYAAVIRRDRD